VASSESFGAFLVFLLSTKCNLECVYCNVDAGPHGFRPVLDPRLVERWLEAFAGLGASQIGIQFHCGEPLIVDPPVEIFGVIARNTLARFPGATLTTMNVQSNGVVLDDKRIRSLARAGIRVHLSIDGPAGIHDSQRPAAQGRGSHCEALQAHHRLRSHGDNSGVISVVTDPVQVVPTVQFFLEEGFHEAVMNPVRPEGRGAGYRKFEEPEFMRDMAREFASAASLIAAYNASSPNRPFIEHNLAGIMDSLIAPGSEPAGFHWTFLIDGKGQLWAHPGSYGITSRQLTQGELPNREVLRSALGLDASSVANGGVVDGLRLLRDRLFSACRVCKSPDFCIPYYGPNHEEDRLGPLCIWRSELTIRLHAWLQEQPEMARLITRGHRTADYALEAQ